MASLNSCVPMMTTEACPINDEVIRPGINLFTMAKLNHGYGAYIGSRERKEMTSQMIIELRRTPEYTKDPLLSFYLSKMERNPESSFDFALCKIGVNAWGACPWMEKLLLDVDVAVVYVACDSKGEEIQEYSDTKYGYEVRQLEQAEQIHWRPSKWVVIDNEVEEEIIDAIVQENQQRLDLFTERMKQARANQASIRQQTLIDSDKSEKYLACSEDESVRTETLRFTRQAEELSANPQSVFCENSEDTSKNE